MSKFCHHCGAPLYRLRPDWVTCRRGHHQTEASADIALLLAKDDDRQRRFDAMPAHAQVAAVHAAEAHYRGEDAA